MKFAGGEQLRNKLKLKDPLTLLNLRKLSKFNGLTYEEFPPHVQLHLRTRPLKIVTLNDKSDDVLRIDLFERLNTGGIKLTNQEIRDCVFHGKFANVLDTLAKDEHFKTVLKLTKTQEDDGTREECVLRFFAFLDRYHQFDHSVKEFLDTYMRDASKKFAYDRREKEFKAVFEALSYGFPYGIMRDEGKGRTPLNLYEGVAVGAALAMREREHLYTRNIHSWIDCGVLRDFTTGATNDRGAVRGRIEFCRDRFLGKRYVQRNKD